MKKIVLIFSVSLLVLYFFVNSKQEKLYSPNVQFILDSVFVNQYKDSTLVDPIYIYCYFSIFNNSSDTLSIKLPLTCFENPGSISQLYGVYSNDTINFYSGSSSKLLPNETQCVVMRYGDCNVVEQMFEKYRKNHHEYFSDFVFDFISHSKLMFHSDGAVNQIDIIGAHVVFRDTKDAGENMWPLL